MTDLLQRVTGDPSPSRGESPPRPVAVSACVASCGAAVAGLVLCCGVAMIVWLGGSEGSSADALRVGALGWLVAHGSAVTVAGVTVSALPLGLMAAIGIAMFSLSARLASGSRFAGLRDVLVFAGTGGASYALLLAVVAWLSGTDHVAVGPARAALAGFVLAAVAGGLGVARQSGLLATWWQAVPERVRFGARGGACAAAVLFGAALALVIVMLLGDTATFGRLWSGLRPGLAGGLGLVLLSLVLLPNLVVWATAVLLGPGIAVGTGTSVTLTHAALGPVPALPVLAALPSPGDLPDWAVVLGVVPLVAGGVGGYLAARAAATTGLLDALGLGAGTGAVTGVACGLVLAASAGSIGPGRMSEVGPDALLSLGVAVLTLGMGGAAGAALGHYRVARAHDAAE